ncbi:MAG TPA: DUF3750 domain-containing protein [Burkholderiaceae bacterium]|nr:DUF3750 domain-containing protein [Burkholderiaceae bacterium]
MSSPVPTRRRRLAAGLRWPARGLAVIALLLLGPLASLVFSPIDLGLHWASASRASSGLAPDPAVERAAVIQVYSARAFHWRGAFGVHTWIAAKRTGAAAYTVYQVIGWRLYQGGSSLSVRESEAPDARWYGALPTLLAQRRGSGVDALIDRLEAAVAAYPYADRYTVWPGPNSNTFIAFMARALPELAVDLPANAIGKDYLAPGTWIDRVPSGTGWQVSAGGLLGASLGREEGLEFNVLGLSAGIDFNDLALRLPGLGRVGGLR